MKRLFFLFVLLIDYVVIAFAQTDVMYVYRNDGIINAFQKVDIDSIRHSKLDLDSVAHQVSVVQEVWTADSTYRIPLALIDSVGFVTPSTLYKEGAYPISNEMLNYIMGSDSLAIYFSMSTPKHLLPDIGDKLVFDRVTNTLPHGFLGQVGELKEESTRIVVNCNALGFSDVFARYYSFSMQAEDNEGTRSDSDINYSSWGPVTVTPDPIQVDLSGTTEAALSSDPYGNLAIKMDEIVVKGEIHPKYTISAYLIVSDELGVNYHVSYVEDYTCTSAICLSGQITNQIDHGIDFDINLPAIPFIRFYGELGLFNRANMSGSIKHEHIQHLSYKTDIDFSSRLLFCPIIRNSQTILTTDNETDAMINGQYDLGFYGELGLKFADKWVASLALRAEAGIRLGGNAVLYAKDSEKAFRSTEVYNSLLNTELYLNWFETVGARAKALWFEWTGDYPSLYKEENIFKACPVPRFTNTTIERYSDAPEELFVQTQASGISLPVDLGFTLFEDAAHEGVSEVGATYYCETGYQGPTSFLTASIFDTDPKKGYTVYPTVKLWNIEMIAEPSAEIEYDYLREQLIRFYQSTGGDNWVHKENWCTDAPIEEWYGVRRVNDELFISLRDNNLCGDVDLSGCASLRILDCFNNQITNLNVSNCDKLLALGLGTNQLISLNVYGCSALKYLDCNFNKLSYLDVSECNSLESINCDYNELNSINISGCFALRDLCLQYNQLSGSLDVSECKYLKYLSCNDNQLTNLNFSGCTALEYLYCDHNQLVGNLDISGLTSLVHVTCYGNLLTGLEASGCTSLEWLICNGNHINQEIPEEFDMIPSFYYDTKYFYRTDSDGVLQYDVAEYGWWYPGEPESGHHIR